MKRLTITVGIPVYNEARNILDLITSIKLQDGDNFVVKKIVIHSDGSTDKTGLVIKRSFKDVQVFDHKINLGKALRVNQILKSNTSDILILADADITIKKRDVFFEIVKTFKKNRSPGIVCIYHRANRPKVFVGKLAYFGYKVWDRARSSLGNYGVRYYCEGGMIAFSKKFAKEFRLPEKYHVGDDTYSFYWAMANNFNVTVAYKARAYIDLPNSFRDYIRQMKRFLTDPRMVVSKFEPRLKRKFETMTSRVKLTSLFYELSHNPLVGTAYLVLQSYVKIQMIYHKQSINWIPIKRL